ncbi:MAG: CHAD domain-containing protein [Streptosporangiales bacterium]|nr:CHAD domain-containing protein [Streptosporangiales bacterium]
MTSQTLITKSADLSAKSRAGEVVLAYLDGQATRLRVLEPEVRAGTPDAVHQMRVTARRLRAALQVFPALWPAPVTGPLKDDLQWLGRTLGEARDVEVLSGYLESGLEDLPAELVLGPAKARVTVQFASRAATAREGVDEALDSPRYLALLAGLSELLAAPPRTAAALAPAGDVLPAGVARAWQQTRRRMRRAERTAAGPRRDEALHEARKAARRARYAAEAVTPVYGKKARRFTKRIKALASALGEQHDAVAARAEARDAGVQAHLAGESAFSFGLLHERANADARASADRARHAWHRAAKPKSVRWLR